MTDDNIQLSRRRVLAGLGTAGLASAGAGLGTSALFSDTESFENNTLTAGTLDLKVDWQQIYAGPTEQPEFVNAHPDHDGDGEQSLQVQDGVVRYSDESRNIVDHLTCQNLSGDYEENFGDQANLVSLSDVKPGDEGEITFSLHLCDNPGYIWLTADDFSQSGGATTEPEEAELDDGATDDGELAENTFVEIWYDEDCDNQLDRSSEEEGQELEVALVSDVSGSMTDSIGDLQVAATNFVDQLAAPDEAAAVSFASSASVDQPLTTDYQAVKDEINNYTANGSTNMDGGIDEAADELLNGTNATAGANKVMIVLGDGTPDSESATAAAATAAKDDGIRVFTIALGSNVNQTFMESIASSPDDAYVAPSASDLQSIYADIAQVVTSGEQVILGVGDGEHDSPVTLAEAMSIIENNDGMVPLDGTGEMGYGAGDTAEERDCFAAQTSHCIGVRWWVPLEVGNEIQGDEVSFDLGFYTEQCRNNDGARSVQS
ncbi:vWA domain-containing protein [Halorientalis halophila]|uniref:vWA domain-containing protein n=1 Tax=Halorientalis halophila TaxID=3108499 RepID=UPI00300A8930